MLPTGFRTFHFVSFLYVFLFSFLFLLFRFFSHYFVFVFLRFVFFSFLFVTFLLVFFSFFFFPFLFVSFRFFPFLSLQVPQEKRVKRLNRNLKMTIGHIIGEENWKTVFKNKQKVFKLAIEKKDHRAKESARNEVSILLIFMILCILLKMNFVYTHEIPTKSREIQKQKLFYILYNIHVKLD